MIIASLKLHWQLLEEAGLLTQPLRNLTHVNGTAAGRSSELLLSFAMLGAHHSEGAEGAEVHGAAADRALHLQPRLDGVRRICVQ